MRKKDQKGQTSVEYMLMIAVAISLGFTFSKKMNEYFFKNPNSFITKSLNNYRFLFSGNDGGRPYKRFSVVRLRENRRFPR